MGMSTLAKEFILRKRPRKRHPVHVDGAIILFKLIPLPVSREGSVPVVAIFTHSFTQISIAIK
jgi:hypothetical protein